jgi:hypothetical protein
MSLQALIHRLLLFLVITFTPVWGGDLYKKKTKNLQVIYYDKGHAYIVPHLTRCFTNSLHLYSRLFHYTPTEAATVFLNDFLDFGHGGALAIPWNTVKIGIEPFDYAYEVSPTNERMNWLMHHELAHVVATDQASPTDRFFRALFQGKVAPTAENPLSMFYSYLTNPRWYSPRWYHEGIAVFLETWMSGGIGRALGGYDEMVFRTMVRDSSYFYDVVGLESEGTTIDFQVGQNSYLYGTRFVSYLAEQYGPEKVLRWFNRDDENKRYFAAAFKHLYGISLDEAWSQWIKWERQWQRANLDSIRLYPTTPYRPLAPHALGSVSRAYYEASTKKIYTAINYPGEFAHLASLDLDTGEIENICDVLTPSLYYVCALAYDHSTGSLFFTTDNVQQWRDLNVVNVKSGKTRMLMKNCRIGDLVFNQSDQSLWGVQHHQGLSSLVKIPPPYHGWQTMLKLPYGKDVFDLDISPDGKFLTASLIEISGRQSLIGMQLPNLLNGDSSYETLFEFENNSPLNFVFSPDGKFLYGTSYYTGVSNVFRYDFASKKMEAITNSETGFFRPVPITSDSLIVFSYTGKGFLPVMIPSATRTNVGAIRFLGQEIVEKFPIVKSWTAPSPASIQLDSLAMESGQYQAWRNLRLASVYPLVEGYKNFAAVGLRLNFFDPLILLGVDLTVSYAPNRNLPSRERPHVALKYHHRLWEMAAAYNSADFYDLFGPTKTSRKGYALSLRYNNSLLHEHVKKMDYSFHVAGYSGLERLPGFQNVTASFDKFLTVDARLNYSFVRRTLGGVEPEQGVKWQLLAQNHYVNRKVFPRVFANFDYGKLLPIDHSSLWLRSSLGCSFGDRDEPFANFYFGGFGNNWIDYQEAQRYREYYSFPGVELNAIGGRNYGKMMLEWTLPPFFFRRLGFTSLYCRWGRLALFSSGIVTGFDSGIQRRKLLNAGGQLDFQLVLFSVMKSTFSLGYAAAVEKDRRLSKELMISLKILE